MLSGSSYRLGSACSGSSYRYDCRPQRSGCSYRSDPLGWDYCFSFRNHTLRSHYGTLAMLGILKSRKRSAEVLDDAQDDLKHVLARLQAPDQG